MVKLPAPYLAEAAMVLCAVLDVLASPPEQPLPSHLVPILEPALNLLFVFNRIPPTPPEKRY